MKAEILTPEFVEFMPEEMSEGVLYISENFEIAIHLCPCGCRNKVSITFGSWADSWLLTNEIGLITLIPSIGNRFACRSHYWIRNNQVIWA